MIGFWHDYLTNEPNGGDYYALPLRCSNLSGLPPAYVLTAEHDPLRDEGNLYAQSLAKAGVPTQMRCVMGSIHGFVRAVEHSPMVRQEIADLGKAIREATPRA